MVTVENFLNLLIGSDRVQIVKGGEILFNGWKSSVPDQYKNETVKLFRVDLEIRHKQWEKEGLMPPLEPKQTPDFSFSDLIIKLYYKICI